MDHSKRRAAGGEIARKFSTNHNTFTVGGSYALDDLMLVKFKPNNHGTLGSVLQHQIIRKSVITISSELDTKALDKIPKFGVCFALRPERFEANFLFFFQGISNQWGSYFSQHHLLREIVIPK